MPRGIGHQHAYRKLGERLGDLGRERGPEPVDKGAVLGPHGLGGGLEQPARGLRPALGRVALSLSRGLGRLLRGPVEQQAPSASISSTSWPIGTLIAASCRQCANGSPQACTLKCHSPWESGVTSAPYRSEPSASSRMITSGATAPDGSRSTTPVPSISCPSRNTVAVTWNVSPTVALAGRRPQSTWGWTSSTGILPITRESYPDRPQYMQPTPDSALSM